MTPRGKVRSDLVLGSKREVSTVGVVAAMCGFYASSLTLGSDVLTANALRAGGASAVRPLLSAVAAVFIAIAIYVAAVVITNSVDTVVAGRLRHIAVLRLLGADAGSLRAAVVRGSTIVAAVGAVVGVVAGTLVGNTTRVILVARGSLQDDDYTWFPLLSVPAILVITLAAATAATIGSRAVLKATPAQALLGASVPAPDRRAMGGLRRTTMSGLIGMGSLTLLAAGAVGEQSGPSGFLLAAFGSMLSATGILIGARLIVPTLVSLASRMLGTDPPSVLAARNAVRDPGRTTRSTMGLVIGVTLVTTFAAGFAALRTSARSWDQTAAQAAETDQILRNISVILICVVVISSAIAAVGFVTTMSLGVIQRTREIGLLRSLGFTGGQVRVMITKESLALSSTAVVFGMALGLAYGAAGAQALVGSQTDEFVWGIPGAALVAIAASGVTLVLAASWVPSARAVAIAPIEAMRVSG